MIPVKPVLSLLVGAAALTLGACDGVVVNRSEVAGGYTGFLYVQTQAANGTNAVMVRNAPFPPDTVVSALRARYQSDQYRFGLGPTPADWNGYTVVLGFGGTPVGNQNLCQIPDLLLPPAPSGQTALIGNYCYGRILVTAASGWTRAVASPDDPRFKNLVGDVVAELFAYRPRYGKHGSGGGVSVP